MKNIKRKLKRFEDALLSRIKLGEREEPLNHLATSLISGITDDDISLNRITQNLDSYSFEVLVQDLGNVLTGQSGQLNRAIVGWKLVQYQLLIDEFALYTRALGYRSWEKFDDEISHGGGDKFIASVWSLCAFYYFDMKINWPIEPIKLLEIAVMRGDIDFELKNNNEFPLLIPLVKFLYADEKRKISLEQLSEHERFSFIKDAWYDDDLFRAGLEELCLWHIEKSSDAYRYGSYYPVGHYALFPVWIYALDKCRERELGRSALPDNPLMEYGKKVREASIEQSDNDVLKQLEAFYKSKFAGKEIDFYKFWEEFKSNKN